MKIDIFNHVLPPAYLEGLERHAGEQPLVRYSTKIRPLWDIEERLRMLAPWPDLQQVLTLGQPTPELDAGPQISPELARLANDGMARIRDAHRERFPAFVASLASLPMNNLPVALEEMDRAVGGLGARGIQVLTSVDGRPLDHPDFFPLFERAAQHHGVPVWLHPYKGPGGADYPSRSRASTDLGGAGLAA